MTGLARDACRHLLLDERSGHGIEAQPAMALDIVMMCIYFIAPFGIVAVVWRDRHLLRPKESHMLALLSLFSIVGGFAFFFDFTSTVVVLTERYTIGKCMLIRYSPHCTSTYICTH
jgi:hypothetical protein